MSTVTATIRLRATEGRRQLAAGTFILLGAIDILLFGLFSRAGDASFEWSISGSGVQIPAIHLPAALVCYVVGAISVALGIWRYAVEPGQGAKRAAIGAVLVCFLIALLCWADAGDTTAVNIVNLMQQSSSSMLTQLAPILCTTRSKKTTGVPSLITSRYAELSFTVCAVEIRSPSTLFDSSVVIASRSRDASSAECVNIK